MQAPPNTRPRLVTVPTQVEHQSAPAPSQRPSRPPIPWEYQSPVTIKSNEALPVMRYIFPWLNPVYFTPLRSGKQTVAPVSFIKLVNEHYSVFRERIADAAHFKDGPTFRSAIEYFYINILRAYVAHDVNINTPVFGTYSLLHALTILEDSSDMIAAYLVLLCVVTDADPDRRAIPDAGDVANVFAGSPKNLPAFMYMITQLSLDEYTVHATLWVYPGASSGFVNYSIDPSRLPVLATRVVLEKLRQLRQSVVLDQALGRVAKAKTAGDQEESEDEDDFNWDELPTEAMREVALDDSGGRVRANDAMFLVNMFRRFYLREMAEFIDMFFEFEELWPSGLGFMLRPVYLLDAITLQAPIYRSYSDEDYSTVKRPTTNMIRPIERDAGSMHYDQLVNAAYLMCGERFMERILARFAAYNFVQGKLNRADAKHYRGAKDIRLSWVHVHQAISAGYYKFALRLIGLGAPVRVDPSDAGFVFTGFGVAIPSLLNTLVLNLPGYRFMQPVDRRPSKYLPWNNQDSLEALLALAEKLVADTEAGDFCVYTGMPLIILAMLGSEWPPLMRILAKNRPPRHSLIWFVDAHHVRVHYALSEAYCAHKHQLLYGLVKPRPGTRVVFHLHHELFNINNMCMLNAFTKKSDCSVRISVRWHSEVFNVQPPLAPNIEAQLGVVTTSSRPSYTKIELERMLGYLTNVVAKVRKEERGVIGTNNIPMDVHVPALVYQTVFVLPLGTAWEIANLVKPAESKYIIMMLVLLYLDSWFSIAKPPDELDGTNEPRFMLAYLFALIRRMSIDNLEDGYPEISLEYIKSYFYRYASYQTFAIEPYTYLFLAQRAGRFATQWLIINPDDVMDLSAFMPNAFLAIVHEMKKAQAWYLEEPGAWLIQSDANTKTVAMLLADWPAKLALGLRDQREMSAVVPSDMAHYIDLFAREFNWYNHYFAPYYKASVPGHPILRNNDYIMQIPQFVEVLIKYFHDMIIMYSTKNSPVSRALATRYYWLCLPYIVYSFEYIQQYVQMIHDSPVLRSNRAWFEPLLSKLLDCLAMIESCYVLLIEKKPRLAELWIAHRPADATPTEANYWIGSRRNEPVYSELLGPKLFKPIGSPVIMSTVYQPQSPTTSPIIPSVVTRISPTTGQPVKRRRLVFGSRVPSE